MKKHILRIIIAVCLISIPAYNLFGNINKKSVPVNSAPVDISAIKEIESVNVATVQKEIKDQQVAAEAERIENELRESREKGVDSIKSDIDSGETNLKKIFSNTLIAGDSLIEAVSLYHVLDSENVMGKVNASLYELDSISDTIISYQPEVLILHYGENHISGSSQRAIDNFTYFYSELIENFKQKLPDTRIVISSIFLPSKEGLENSPHLINIPLYNDALKEMCKECDVEFLDNSPVFQGEPDFFGGDGVHMDRAFYSEYWLPFVAYELNL